MEQKNAQNLQNKSIEELLQRLKKLMPVTKGLENKKPKLKTKLNIKSRLS